LQSRSRIYITEDVAEQRRRSNYHKSLSGSRAHKTRALYIHHHRLRLGPGTRKQMPVYIPCRIFGTHDQTQLICPSRPSHRQLFQSKEAHQRLTSDAIIEHVAFHYCTPSRSIESLKRLNSFPSSQKYVLKLTYSSLFRALHATVPKARTKGLFYSLFRMIDNGNSQRKMTTLPFFTSHHWERN
jgi:hypothetical protein